VALVEHVIVLMHKVLYWQYEYYIRTVLYSRTVTCTLVLVLVAVALAVFVD